MSEPKHLANPSVVVKKSVSFSAIIAEWAEELAAKKGFGTNFSSYIADLVRRDKERDEEYEMAAIRGQGKQSPKVNSGKLKAAKDQVVAEVELAFPSKKTVSRVK